MSTARVKYVLGGSLQGVEQWSVSWHSGGEVGNQTTLDAMAAAITTYITGSASSLTGYKSLMGSDSTFDYIKLYDYPDGATHADLISEGIFHVTGGVPSTTHPLQVCAVATLHTAIPTRRTRGRMYWPAVGATLGQSRGTQMNASDCDKIAAFTKALFATQGADIFPSVYSRVGQSLERVTGISVDSRCDVQRSRANKQTPTSISRIAYP